MTQETVERRTVGEVMADPVSRAVEMSAARVTNRAGTLLWEALQASDMSQQEIAKRLGVSAGRVSQVLSGDQNLYLTTLARYLSAMGYDLRLEADPARHELPQIGMQRRRIPRGTRETKVSLYAGSAQTSGGTSQVFSMVQHTGDAPATIDPQGTHVHLGQVNNTSRVLLAGPPVVSAALDRAQALGIEEEL